MKIEYTVSADRQVEGNDWVCYYRDSHSFSAVFDLLLTLIKDSKEVEFEKLKTLVKSGYQLSTAKSRANIYAGNDRVEIRKPNKSLPHIWVLRNITHELDIY